MQEPVAGLPFALANAGVTLIANITNIKATTVNNNTMRFIMHHLLRLRERERDFARSVLLYTKTMEAMDRERVGQKTNLLMGL
jgi:hypothetical protein